MTTEDLGAMQDFFTLSKWGVVDYSIAGMLAFSAIFGFLRGFIQEAVSLLVWLAALWVCTQYSQDASTLLQDKITIQPVRLAVACALLFFATLFIGSLINSLLLQIAIKGLSDGERLLGLTCGLLRGWLLIFVLVLLAGATHLPEEAWWKQSQLLPPFQSMAIWLKDHIPPNLAAYINYR
ncbi:MAG: CvpA family protein [Methylococcales bacterium]|nr:CvpA family protein [Methylococcales bacterium]